MSDSSPAVWQGRWFFTSEAVPLVAPGFGARFSLRETVVIVGADRGTSASTGPSPARIETAAARSGRRRAADGSGRRLTRFAQSATARERLAEELMPALPDLAAAPNVRVVRHWGIANDVIRADRELLVTPRVDGCTANASPVLHLRRLATAPLSGVYLTGLDHVFDTAAPWRPTRTEVTA
jgi:hypothetical protein